MALASVLSLLVPKSKPDAPTATVEHNDAKVVSPVLEQQVLGSTVTPLKLDALDQCSTQISSSQPMPPVAHRDGCDHSGDLSQSRASDMTTASRPCIFNSGTRRIVARPQAYGHTQATTASPSPHLTEESVHAAHLSSPSNILSSHCHNTQMRDFCMQSTFDSLISNLELSRLTDGARTLNVKATPPITPRTLSNDGTEASQRTISPNHRSTGATESNGTSTPRSGAPVSPPKGELVVTISGARGLRPSFDPYAVCVFEWIESIAHHHKSLATSLDNGPGRGDLPVGGLPISRTSSGMGRSMAIPMKSRQGSTASLSDQKEFKAGTEVTDPQWDHEAVLFVECPSGL